MTCAGDSFLIMVRELKIDLRPSLAFRGTVALTLRDRELTIAQNSVQAGGAARCSLG